MTGTEGLQSAALSSDPGGIQQVGTYTDFDSNGDFAFAGDGFQKHLMFYKQVSDYSGAFSWSDVQSVTGYFVTNYGRRLSYRIVGYTGGAEVFRSGLAEYGTPVNIRGASFQYFDVWLVDKDDDGNLVEVGTLVTSKLQFDYGYIAVWPTERPGEQETIPVTDYGIDTPTIPDVTLNLPGATDGVYAPFMEVIDWLFTLFLPWLWPLLLIVFLRFVVYGKEGD